MRGLKLLRRLAGSESDTKALAEYARRSLTTSSGLKEVLQEKIPEQQV